MDHPSWRRYAATIESYEVGFYDAEGREFHVPYNRATEQELEEAAKAQARAWWDGYISGVQRRRYRHWWQRLRGPIPIDYGRVAWLIMGIERPQGRRRRRRAQLQYRGIVV
jgi:hypothetical protein